MFISIRGYVHVSAGALELEVQVDGTTWHRCGEPTQVLRKSIMCSTEPALQALAKIFLNIMLTNLKVKESGVQKKSGCIQFLESLNH